MRTITARLATAAGRSPERAAASATCLQCGRDGTTEVIRLGPRHARYWCRRCQAVVSMPDLSRLHTGPPPAPTPAEEEPATADPLAGVMPDRMVTWVRHRREQVDPQRLDKGVVYGLYSRFDRATAEAATSEPARARWEEATGTTWTPAVTGLPSFGQVCQKVQRTYFLVEPTVAALVGTDSDPQREQAIRERVRHARAWLAGPARDRCWVVGQAASVDPPASEVEPLVSLVAPDRMWSAEQARVLHGALFGIGGGPPLSVLISEASPERVRDALRAYLADGSRPLRDAVLDALDGADSL